MSTPVTMPLVKTCYDAITKARSFLNDETGVTWPDARLFPILKVAHSELSAKLVANGIAAVRNQSITINVPAITILTWGATGSNFPANLVISNTNPSTVSSVSYTFLSSDPGRILTLSGGTNVIPGGYEIESVTNGVATLAQNAMSGAPANDGYGFLGYQSPIPLPNMPSNLIFPISMMEKQPTDDVEFYLPMTQVNFVPQVDPVEELVYWAWMGNQIMLVGATQNVNVILRYRGSLAVPNTLNDSLGFIFAENYLGARIAALAYMSVNDSRWSDYNSVAEAQLDLIVRMNVVGNQGVGVRRMAYRRGLRRRVF